MRELPAWLAQELPFQRREVQAGGLRFHLMESGPEDGPVALLVHGNPTWGFLWRKVMRSLRGVRCVVPDLAGLGLSEAIPDEEHRLELHQQRLGALIRELDLRSVTLCVQDWGGAIGVGAFLGQEERLGGLVVLNTALTPPREGFKPTAFHRFAQMRGSELVFRGLGFPQNCLWTAQGSWRSIGWRETRAYRWALKQHPGSPLALARMVPDSLEHPSVQPLHRVEELVTGFEGPAAIVWGSRDPILGRLQRRHERMLPGASSLRTEGGHFLQEEEAAAIAAAIERVAGDVAHDVARRTGARGG